MSDHPPSLDGPSPAPRLMAVAVSLLCGWWIGSAGAAEEAGAPAGHAGMLAPYREIELAARSDGVVSQVLVEEGQPVVAHQVLARLEDIKESLEVEYQKLLVEKRAGDLKALEELFAEEVVSKDELEQKRVEWKLAETQYQLAQQRFEEKAFRSPIDGFLVRQYKEVGESIKSLEPFARLMQVDKLYAVVHLEQKFLGQVRLHQPATVHEPGAADPPLRGVVEVADPVVDPASGLFRVKVAVDNPDLRLRPGTPIRVLFLEQDTRAP